MAFPIDLVTSLGELPVTLHVTSAHKGSPGSFNPRDGGTPPEPPEVEFRVLLKHPDPAQPRLDITDYLDSDTIEALLDEVVETLDDNMDVPDGGADD